MTTENQDIQTHHKTLVETTEMLKGLFENPIAASAGCKEEIVRAVTALQTCCWKLSILDEKEQDSH